MKEKEAVYYTKDRDTVRCFLCPHGCVLKPGQTGICRARKNIGGSLFSMNYGRVSAYNIDPIEKKPLYHFYPGGRIVSVGSFGCNLKCSFCQNHAIAHGSPGTVFMSPGELVDRAQAAGNSIGIAYTYNEPSIWYEYVFDTARLAKEKGLKNVLVTNGYIGAEALDALLPFVDAANIDLKAFSDGFYSKVCAGRLSPVLETIKRASERCHVEVTTLVVEDLNSGTGELDSLAEWVGSISKKIPLHLSRYFPAYHMDRPPTSPDVLLAAREAAEKHLDYVYVGNMSGVDNSTYCPVCKTKLVERNLVNTRVLTKGSRCKKCGETLSLVL